MPGYCRSFAAGRETFAKRLQPRSADRGPIVAFRWGAAPFGSNPRELAWGQTPHADDNREGRLIHQSYGARDAGELASCLRRYGSSPLAGRPGEAVPRDRSLLERNRMPSSVTSTTSTHVHRSLRSAAAALRQKRREGPPRIPPALPGADEAERPEVWVTKRQLAAHLQVTPRWIELQHPRGLPHLRRDGIVRYRISEVERWLRDGGEKGGE